MISKIIILTVFCSVVHVLAGGKRNQILEAAKDKCKCQTSDAELSKALAEKNFPDNMNCYIGCIAIELKWLTLDGAFNQEHANKVVQSVTEEHKRNAQKLFDKIKSAVGDTTGHCESGTKLLPMANEYIKENEPEGDELAVE